MPHKKVWAVMIGEYEDYSVRCIFSSKEEAEKYSYFLNFSKKDKSYSEVVDYDIAESAESAVIEDDRLRKLYEEDRETWLKEIHAATN